MCSGVCQLGGQRRDAERRHSARPDRRLQARGPDGAPAGGTHCGQVLDANSESKKSVNVEVG